jgi:hypothetical protein
VAGRVPRGSGPQVVHPDGRYLGELALLTDTTAHPTDHALDLISLLAPTIVEALDPLRSALVLAGMVGDATAGIVLTRAGEPLPLPGLASHLLLSAGSAVLAVAAAHLRPGFPPQATCTG